MARYVIRGGQEGYDRLRVLARDRRADTVALLGRAGVGGAQRCVDLGCGGGEVTFELATLVAPDGEVVGVDMDETKLALAREAATERGITNATFVAMDVGDWDEPDAYDVVYSRFLLHHLAQPRELLGRMWAAVRPGGALVVEDADHEGWCGHPTNAGLTFFVRTFCEVLRRRGGDPTMGRKLFQCFAEAGIPTPDLALVQPARTEGEEKSLPYSTLEFTADAIIEEDVAPAEAVEQALASLRRFTDDPRTLISGPRIFQLCSRRAARA
ncbi:MAG TPA: methyltransferase domain-containing protein [Acidimicrobiales bacterium]|nr:methyltransferase domain-containing protein [Acidimicrobiales bacterium]